MSEAPGHVSQFMMSLWLLRWKPAAVWLVITLLPASSLKFLDCSPNCPPRQAQARQRPAAHHLAHPTTIYHSLSDKFFVSRLRCARAVPRFHCEARAPWDKSRLAGTSSFTSPLCLCRHT